jgi:hypothetical protein
VTEPATIPIAAWRFSPRGIAWRLALTVYLVYAIHFATDVVREHYLAASLGEHLSFRVDEYAGLHPDLFETPGRGWHIGNNPGASMLGAIPVAITGPAINWLTEKVRSRRAADTTATAPAFDSPRPNARVFYAEAWRRGLDVKLGLVALVTHLFMMAPMSALFVALLFAVLRQVNRSDRLSAWLALLYAFGTPAFFRTGFLNHNLILAHVAFAGFAVAWNPWRGSWLSERARVLLAGVLGGMCILLDYTGAVMTAGLGLYVCCLGLRRGGWAGFFRAGARYTLAALGPILLLWFAQYQEFGHPFYPGQHWMPRVAYSTEGFDGFGIPRLDLFLLLIFDLRYGLFVASPMLALGLLAPLYDRGQSRLFPKLEARTMMGLMLGLWVFCAGIIYTYLQWNAGIRYMIPILPFLFLLMVPVLLRMPARLAAAFVLASVTLSWSLAMYRLVIADLGILDTVIRTFTAGFTLPVLRTLSYTAGQYGDYASHGVSPLPIFLFVAVCIALIWSRSLSGGGWRRRLEQIRGH